MLYVVGFEFHTPDEEQPRHGHFTVVVEADGPEAALDACADRIEAVHEHANLLDEGTTIYVDTIVELAKVPPEGALLGYVCELGESVGSIDCALPVSVEGATSFGWSADPDDPESGEPFLVID